MINYGNEMIVVSNSDHKLAALFFDRIVPTHSYDEVPQQIRLAIKDEVHREGPYWRVATLPFNEYPTDMVMANEKMGEKASILYTLLNPDKASSYLDAEHSDIARDVYSKLDREGRAELQKELDNIMISMRDWLTYNIAEALRADGMSFVPAYGCKESDEVYGQITRGNFEAIEIVFENMPLVMTSSADWKQILDFRKDKDSVRKFRNFKLFLFDNYTSRNQAYIKDSIDKKIEEYRSACKKHGFQKTTTTLTFLFDSKSLLGMAGIITAGILVNNPVAITAAAVSGAVIEVGRMCISFAKQSAEHRSFKDNYELAYIIDVEKKFGSQSG